MNATDKMNNMKWGVSKLAKKKMFPGLKPWQGGKRNFFKECNIFIFRPSFPP